MSLGDSLYFDIPTSIHFTDKHAYLSLLFPSISSIKSYDYISWYPIIPNITTNFKLQLISNIDECTHEIVPVDAYSNMLFELFLTGISCLILMFILIAWSKYAEWRWSGRGIYNKIIFY